MGTRLRMNQPDRVPSLRRAGCWLGQVLVALAIPAVFTLAAGVRAFHVLSANFPLNDGGLFYVMAQDIQASSFGIPEFTSYNAHSIPLVYPPLGLYAAALFDSLTPASLSDGFQVLPLAGAIFSVWAFWRLGNTILGDSRAALLATLAFALVPRSFAWLIMGGGLPRAWALGFALLAVSEAYRLAFHERDDSFSTRKHVVLLGGFAGITALTHLETAAFLAVTCLVMVLMRPRRFGEYAIAGGIATLLALPWGALMLAYHGLDPFLSSLDHGGPLLDDGGFTLERLWDVLRDPIATGEPYFPIVGALGLIGAYVAIARGQWFLPAWWLVTMLFAMRAYPTFVSVPTGLLAGMIVVQVIVPSLRGTWESGALKARLAVAFAGAGALFLAFSGAVERDIGQARFLRALPADDRAAMEWVSENTPKDAAFVVAPARAWYADYHSEWFPALADRTSVATPQGYEWIEGEFSERANLHSALASCGDETYLCFRAALKGVSYEYIYVPSTCCESLRRSLLKSSRYETLYYEDGAIVVSPRLRGSMSPHSQGPIAAPAAGIMRRGQ